MTFPAKENLIFFENLEKTQTQLFDDAADMGIEVTGLPVKAEARKHLMALMENYAYKLNKYEAGSVTDIFIPFEFDEGAYVGVTLNVDFCKANGREWLLIDIRPTRKTHSEIEGKLFKMPK
jgi:hypothetical protein